MSDEPVADGGTVGAYRLTETLQTFPYATVHRAVHGPDERTVLLWRFRDPYATAAGFVEALEQLAGDPRTQSVPGLVTVQEVGTTQEGDPLAYLVSGDVPGGFLVPALELRRAPGVFATAAALGATLDAAHALGLVHGDVQPATVVLDETGRPALVGLAVRTVVARVTPDADWIPAAAGFRPPERSGESEADAAADRYGLAALVYYLLCGHTPDGHEPVAPSHWRPGVPARVDAVVLRALSRNPAERFPSAGLFTAALTGGPPPTATPMVAPAATPTAAPAPPVPVDPAPGRQREESPRLGSQPASPQPADSPAPTPPVPVEPAAPAVPAAIDPPAALAAAGPATEAAGEAERRGRSIWVGVGIALVVGLIAAAAAVVYLLHGTPHAHP